MCCTVQRCYYGTSSQRACQWWLCQQSWSLWVNCTDPNALCQWAIQMHCLKGSKKGFQLITMISSYTKLHIKPPPCDMFTSSLSPALVCPPFLDVTDIIDCAVDCHVIVVAGDVEWTVKFDGPLLKKNIAQLAVFGLLKALLPLKHSVNHIWWCAAVARKPHVGSGSVFTFW